MKSIAIRSQCTCPCHQEPDGVTGMHATACCIPDELEWTLPEPDDIIEALDRLIRQRTRTLDQWPQKPITEQRARDEIETLRAQLAEALEARDQFANLYMDRVGQLNVANSELTTATRRADQAERMLAEHSKLLFESLYHLRLDDGAQAYHNKVTSIRSAASGEQGA